MRKTLKITPFNRVEGDLEISVDIEDGAVVEAHASGVMFRGFEMILKGRDPLDAIVFTPRICGICGGAHSTAASNALKSAFRASMPPNGHLARNIAFACENAMSHATAFYALFAVDLINPAYADHPEYDVLVERFSPMKGTSYIAALRERKRFLGILGLLIGKWPNTLAFHPGGITKALTSSDLTQALGILENFRAFLEETLLGCSVDRWLATTSANDLDRWLGEGAHARGDLGLFLRVGRDLGLHTIGAGPGRFLSFGAYDHPDGSTSVPSGFFDGAARPFEETKVSEHIRYSWFDGYDGGKHPSEGATQPAADKPGAYSWAKAPRYDGSVVEVGPLARMMLANDPLIVDLVGLHGPSVYTRALARLHEAVRLVRDMGAWLGQVDPDEPFYRTSGEERDARGAGLTEAARGALGHWITISGGKIANYQVITPTAWNVSPRDSDGTPGAVEQALVGTPVEDDSNPIAVAHVVRSFDPCLVCTVHAYRGDRHVKSFDLAHAHH